MVELRRISLQRALRENRGVVTLVISLSATVFAFGIARDDPLISYFADKTDIPTDVFRHLLSTALALSLSIASIRVSLTFMRRWRYHLSSRTLRALYSFIMRETLLLDAIVTVYVLGLSALNDDVLASFLSLRLTLPRDTIFRYTVGTFTALLLISAYRFVNFYLNRRESRPIFRSAADDDVVPTSTDVPESNSDRLMRSFDQKLSDAVNRIERHIVTQGRGGAELFRNPAELGAFRDALAENIVKDVTKDITGSIANKLSVDARIQTAEGQQTERMLTYLRASQSA